MQIPTEQETSLTCDRSHECFKFVLVFSQVHHKQSTKGNIKCGSTAHVFVRSRCVNSKEWKMFTLQIKKKPEISGP